jgi:hypothetical protein
LNLIRRDVLPSFAQPERHEREELVDTPGRGVWIGGARIEAARSLGSLGSDAKVVVKALTVLLKDAHPEARSAAAEALEVIEPNERRSKMCALR